ncbi:hypothetical protein ACWEOO_39680, partial [Kribbella sp. NPDC004138]
PRLLLAHGLHDEHPSGAQAPDLGCPSKRGRPKQLIRFGEPVGGRTTLAYVWLSGGSQLTGRLERCFDDGSPSFFDVGEFQNVDDDADEAWDPFSGPPPDDGLRYFDSPESALEWARSECDASDVG